MPDRGSDTIPRGGPRRLGRGPQTHAQRPRPQAPPKVAPGTPSARARREPPTPCHKQTHNDTLRNEHFSNEAARAPAPCATPGRLRRGPRPRAPAAARGRRALTCARPLRSVRASFRRPAGHCRSSRCASRRPDRGARSARGGGRGGRGPAALPPPLPPLPPQRQPGRRGRSPSLTHRGAAAAPPPAGAVGAGAPAGSRTLGAQGWPGLGPAATGSERTPPDSSL